MGMAIPRQGLLMNIDYNRHGLRLSGYFANTMI